MAIFSSVTIVRYMGTMTNETILLDMFHTMSLTVHYIILYITINRWGNLVRRVPYCKIIIHIIIP